MMGSPESVLPDRSSFAGSRNYGQSNNLLAKGVIKTHPTCKKVIKDFEKVQQNRIDFKKVKDKDDMLTHFSDGIDYLCNFEYNIGTRERSKVIKI